MFVVLHVIEKRNNFDEYSTNIHRNYMDNKNICFWKKKIKQYQNNV